MMIIKEGYPNHIVHILFLLLSLVVYRGRSDAPPAAEISKALPETSPCSVGDAVSATYSWRVSPDDQYLDGVHPSSGATLPTWLRYSARIEAISADGKIFTLNWDDGDADYREIWGWHVGKGSGAEYKPCLRYGGMFRVRTW